MGGARHGASAADLEFVWQRLAQHGGPAIPQNFVQTAQGYDPGNPSLQQMGIVCRYRMLACIQLVQIGRLSQKSVLLAPGFGHCSLSTQR